MADITIIQPITEEDHKVPHVDTIDVSKIDGIDEIQEYIYRSPLDEVDRCAECKIAVVTNVYAYKTIATLIKSWEEAPDKELQIELTIKHYQNEVTKSTVIRDSLKYLKLMKCGAISVLALGVDLYTTHDYSYCYQCIAKAANRMNAILGHPQITIEK